MGVGVGEGIKESFLANVVELVFECRQEGKSQGTGLCCLLAVRYRANQLMSLNLSFLFCKMGVIIICRLLGGVSNDKYDIYQESSTWWVLL